MDGQLTIFDYQTDRRKELEKRLPIPRLDKKYLDEEGYIDDWHYCELEQPEYTDVYWTISLSKRHEYYHYEYKAFARGVWWYWCSWRKQWFIDDGSVHQIFAWMQIPSKYRQVDKSLHERLGLKGIIGEE